MALRYLRNLVRRALLNRGIYVSRVVGKDVVAEFFSLIRTHQAQSDLIRIGGMGDGGYLIPDDLAGMEECFSPGVSAIADFEKDLVARGVRCYLADYSVDEPPFQHSLIDFEKKYLGVVDDEKFVRLESWVARKQKAAGDLILQMDIEGAEYRVLLETPDHLLSKFRIIVIEFHHLNRLFEMFGFEVIDLAFRKLLKQFDIVHIHPNNFREPVEHFGFVVPPVMEFTFLRRDRAVTKRPAAVAPHRLDAANVTSLPDVALPACWKA
jgi:hypothetical protein